MFISSIASGKIMSDDGTNISTIITELNIGDTSNMIYENQSEVRLILKILHTERDSYDHIFYFCFSIFYILDS